MDRNFTRIIRVMSPPTSSDEDAGYLTVSVLKKKGGWGKIMLYCDIRCKVTQGALFRFWTELDSRE